MCDGVDVVKATDLHPGNPGSTPVVIHMSDWKGIRSLPCASKTPTRLGSSEPLNKGVSEVKFRHLVIKVRAYWPLMWSETVGLRTIPVSIQQKSVLVLDLVLQVWCCVEKHGLVTLVVIIILKDTATLQVLFIVSLFCVSNITSVEINSGVYLLKSYIFQMPLFTSSFLGLHLHLHLHHHHHHRHLLLLLIQPFSLCQHGHLAVGCLLTDFVKISLDPVRNSSCPSICPVFL